MFWIDWHVSCKPIVPTIRGHYHIRTGGNVCVHRRVCIVTDIDFMFGWKRWALRLVWQRLVCCVSEFTCSDFSYHCYWILQTNILTDSKNFACFVAFPKHLFAWSSVTEKNLIHVCYKSLITTIKYPNYIKLLRVLKGLKDNIVNSFVRKLEFFGVCACDSFWN